MTENAKKLQKILTSGQPLGKMLEEIAKLRKEHNDKTKEKTRMKRNTKEDGIAVSDIDTYSIPELMIVMSTRLLLLAPHSQEYIDHAKDMLDHMHIRKHVKQACIDTLNEVEVK